MFHFCISKFRIKKQKKNRNNLNILPSYNSKISQNNKLTLSMFLVVFVLFQ